jgi:hypothetical protein
VLLLTDDLEVKTAIDQGEAVVAVATDVAAHDANLAPSQNLTRKSSTSDE